MAGYSGTPLAKKLGIKPDSSVFLVDEPDHFAGLLAPAPEGVVFVPALTQDTQLIHLFVSSKSKLRSQLLHFVKAMNAEAVIWVSWPKKASKVATDITEDVIREVALPLGLVDIKVCAVDETWSGLKLVVRKENRSTW
jgi:hypothetical protein